MLRLRRSPVRFVLAGSSILLVVLLIGAVWALKSGWVEINFPVLQRPTAGPLTSAPDHREVVVTSEPSVPELTPGPQETGSIGDAPWVMQPAPPPGGLVSSGPVTVEALGRGDAVIAQIRLQLDDAPLPVTLEQRSQSVWRGQATTSVTPGRHVVQAVVVQADGKVGSYRWSFDASTPR